MAKKVALKTAKSGKDFGQGVQARDPLRVSLYARVSTHDQQALPLQLDSMGSYANQRGWTIVSEAQEIGSGALQRHKPELLMKTARRRETNIILVCRLDRWGRSVADRAITLRELNELGVAFVSLTEALDLTTSTGTAMAGLLSVFAEFEREVYASTFWQVLLTPGKKEHVWDDHALHQSKRWKRVSSIPKVSPNLKSRVVFQSAAHRFVVY